MKISRIEVHKADLAYAGGVYRLSGGREYRAFDATFCRFIAMTGLLAGARARRLEALMLPPMQAGFAPRWTFWRRR